MSASVIYTDMDKIREAGQRYVQDGHPAFRAERQRDVDGTLVFLQSDAAEKLRPPGLQPKSVAPPAPVRTVLDAERERSRG